MEHSAGIAEIAHDLRGAAEAPGQPDFGAGPESHRAGYLKLIFHAFVVIAGFMIMMLSGAINTSIVGSNGVLNRVSKDGLLANWFHRPHRKSSKHCKSIAGNVAKFRSVEIVVN